jgi:hypothetical protein
MTKHGIFTEGHMSLIYNPLTARVTENPTRPGVNYALWRRKLPNAA